MGYIKGYKYDIFISYSHLDNLITFDESRGWVEEFYNDLNILLSRRMGVTNTIKFWWDNRNLDGSEIFDRSIEESLKHSAIMLCLMSPGYMESPYCRKELEFFHNKAKREPIGLNIGNRSRIINILLYNIPYSDWPKELNGTTGFPFHDSEVKDDYGDTIEIKGELFKNKLKDLKDAIVKLIREFPKNNGRDQPGKNPFTIYFGDVAEDLRPIKERTIIDLEGHGYKIVCDIPPPFEAAEHEKLVTEKLNEADLSVHLLDQNAGTKIEGMETMWYPQKQAELSLQSAKPQLIWIPEELNIEAADELPYKTFIHGLETGTPSGKKIEFIRGSKSSLSREIKEFAELLKAQQSESSAKKKLAVLMDIHYNDQQYALELAKCLVRNHIKPLINPQDDDPQKNLEILKKRISLVSTMVFFYGKVTGYWVSERMKAAMQLIVLNNYPIEEFFVLKLPPHKEPEDSLFEQRFFKINIVNNSDAEQLNEGNIDFLLKGIKHEFE